MKKDFTLIVPTNRPEQFKEFISSWEDLFNENLDSIVVCVDLPQIPDEIMKALAPLSCAKIVICQKDVPSWVPTKTDMIRSWGFIRAYGDTRGSYFVTLDDDVRVSTTGYFDSLREQFEQGTVLSEYLDVGALTTSGLQMRGFPYKDRKRVDAAVQYGGWDGTLDYDAATQLASPKGFESFYEIVMPVPKGAAVTCCIMNTAWLRVYTPIMWQLPMFEGRHNRVGDIWSGLFIKKTLDAVGQGLVINGKANVCHERASNPYNSLVKESTSVWMNDNLWENLTNPELEIKEPGLIEAYKNVTDSAYEFFLKHDKDYAKHFIKCRNEWLKHFV